MLKKIKLHFKKYNIELDNDIIIKFNNQKIFKDKIYLVSAWVFENTKINHNLRLRLHRWLINFAKQNRKSYKT